MRNEYFFCMNNQSSTMNQKTMILKNPMAVRGAFYALGSHLLRAGSLQLLMLDTCVAYRRALSRNALLSVGGAA